MTDEEPTMPKSFIPGLVPTMNDTGFMTETLGPYSAEFADFAGSVDKEVLDIGCAYGVATLAALDHGAQVCAADMEPRHLAVLIGRVPTADRARLRTQVAKLPGVDFPAGSFAAVHAGRVLHFLRGEEIDLAVRKMFDWLQPGGKVFLIADTPYTGPWRAAAPQYEERKRRGERWPGFLENYRDSLRWPGDASQQPRMINPLDPDILRRVVSEAGFTVEKAEFLAGATPISPANGHAGVVGRKPG